MIKRYFKVWLLQILIGKKIHNLIKLTVLSLYNKRAILISFVFPLFFSIKSYDNRWDLFLGIFTIKAGLNVYGVVWLVIIIIQF